jgi:ferredoxin
MIPLGTQIILFETASGRFFMKATVKKDVCIGCGLCADTCPEVFVMDDEFNIAKTVSDRVPVELKDKCREATANCPVEAIVIEE